MPKEVFDVEKLRWLNRQHLARLSPRELLARARPFLSGYADAPEGKLAAISAELLGIGRKLADALGQDLSAVLIGSGVGDFASELVSYGADKVYVIDHPALADYTTDGYVAAMETVSYTHLTLPTKA